MDFFKGVLAGSLSGLVLLLLFSVSPLQGETGVGSQGIIAINGNTQAERQDLLYIFDANAQKLAVYQVNNQGVFNLIDVRNVQSDLQLNYLKRQRPSVEAIRKKVR